MSDNTLPRPMKISEAIYRIQFSLIECPSCSTEQLLTAGSLLSRPDYQDVIVERSIVGFCGYPICKNRVPVDRNRRARFKVSLRDQRIYDLEETYKYCSEACQVRSMAFCKSLNTEHVCDLNQAKIAQALRLFGNWDVGGEEFGDEGDLGIKSLSIKEKGIAGAGEVSLNEWIGPANAIEGYVPQRDRISDFGLNFVPQQHSRKKIEGSRDSRAPFANSSLLVGNEASEICLKESSDVKLRTTKKRDTSTADKKTKPKKTTSKTSKLKSKKNPDDYGHGNIDFTSSVIIETEFDDHNALSHIGQDISKVIAKQLENMVLEEKKIGKKVGISKPSRFKDHKKSEDPTNEKVLSKEINGELFDVFFGNESNKTAFNISNYEEISEKKASSKETTVKELEVKISLAKKEISEEKLLKSCLKNSKSRVGDHYVKWVDEKRHVSFEDKMTIPQESSEELFDSSIRFASAEFCATALTQAAESVVSGKAEVGDAVSEAGILILPQAQCLEGEREDDVDIFKFNQGIVKWPKKTVLLDTNTFKVEDSWHDTPPEGFNLNLSPFATMWMALFGWITCSSLAYIYGHEESSYENFILINGKEYPRKVIMSGGQSLEIRQTLDGFICRTLPVVVKDLGLPIPISTLEKFMGCFLNTMSFMDAIPSFKIRQWQVIVLLFIEALSVHRLLVLAPHLMSKGTQLEQMQDSNTVVASNPSEHNEHVPTDNELEIDSDELNNVNTIRDEGSVQKKKRRLTSTVWGHFEMLPLAKDGKPRCKCKKCGSTYLCDSKNGTGNLRRHLQNCKKKNSHDIGQLILQSNSTTSISMVENKFDNQEFRGLLTACIVMHDLPFQCVEWAGFRALLRYLRPDLQFISRNTARNDCKKIFIREKVQIQALLSSCKGRVALTSDLWTSINTDGFICLTAHFIDNNWRLQKKVINFGFMPPPHDGLALFEKLQQLLAEWKLDSKLFSITLDNASANNVSVDFLRNHLNLKNGLLCNGEFFHIRCCAHIVNLIIQEGLKEIDPSVMKVRESIKYVKGSQSRKQKFLECVRQSYLEDNRGLRQDVPTRWNLTFVMLDSAIYFRRAFMHLKLGDSNYKCCPTNFEWDKMMNICKFLAPFYEITCIISGSKYPTANLYFSCISTAYATLKYELSCGQEYIRRMTVGMITKFEKYWSDFSIILAIAVILDPRYKFNFVEWCYKKLYVGDYMIELDKVKEKLEILFSNYSATNEGVSTPESQASKSLPQRSSSSSNSTPIIKSQFLQDYDSFQVEVTMPRKSELEIYLDDPKLDRNCELDILQYWKVNQFRFPQVSRMARDVLCIPISTVASESAFSNSGRVLDQYRSALKHDIVEALVCTKDWLYGEQDTKDPELDAVTDDVMGLDFVENEMGLDHESVNVAS